MFAIYLAGFLLYRSWWYQCQSGADVSSSVSVFFCLQLTTLDALGSSGKVTCV